VTVGIEVLSRDAELILGDVKDAALLGGLGDFDVGFRVLVLRGGYYSNSCVRGIAGKAA
jgi:hypothetical protein